MKVFLSWAGDDSKYIAETLKTWLPQVLQALDPWMSTHIEKGEAWDGAIAEGLSDSPVGILCLTKDSIKSNYLHYEAGAIANVPNSKVCTFLYELKNADVKQPLGRFQHTRFEKGEMLKLLKTINGKLTEVGERSISDVQLEKALEVNWSELEEKLKGTPKSKEVKVERPDRELLEEILERVRSNNFNNLKIKDETLRELEDELLGIQLPTSRLIEAKSHIFEYIRLNQIMDGDIEPHLRNIGELLRDRQSRFYSMGLLRKLVKEVIKENR